MIYDSTVIGITGKTHGHAGWKFNVNTMGSVSLTAGTYTIKGEYQTDVDQNYSDRQDAITIIAVKN
jgi:hypothetical protein